MTSYGIGVKNSFTLLGDDDDAPVMHSQTVVVKPTVTKKANASTDRPRGNRGDQRRGAGNRRPGERRGKREFDRHSGSGRTADTKREGNGRYNWGRDGDAGEENDNRRPRGPRRQRRRDEGARDESAAAADKEKKPEDKAEGAGSDANEAEAEAENSEDEQQDLQEYMKKMKELAVVDDSRLSIRKAVEDDDNTEALDREAVDEEEDELLSAGGIQSRKGGKKKSKKKGAISLEEFTKGQRRRRGDRERHHGSYAPRSGGRADKRSGVASVDIEDQSAFPSLLAAQ